MNKIVLMLVDGMRPDGMMECGHPFPAKLLEKSSYSLNAQTVKPSVTLPCHMSLFHSVDPDRHGIVTNTYVPQVRPIAGMFDHFDAIFTPISATTSTSRPIPIRRSPQPPLITSRRSCPTSPSSTSARRMKWAATPTAG